VLVFLAQSGVQSGDLTPELLKQELQRSIAALESCHALVANRGDFSSLAEDRSGAGVTGFEFWISGEHLQMQQFPATQDASTEWFQRFEPRAKPLDSASLGTIEGLTYLVRTDQTPNWVQFLRVPKSRPSAIPTNYLTSSTKRQLPLFLAPLIAVGRNWNLVGESPYVDSVAQAPISRWQILGKHELDGQEMLVVDVRTTETFVPVPLKRHSGSLELSPVWRCWFSLENGHCPMRITTSMRYRYGDKDFAAAVDPRSPNVYRVSEVQNVYGDLWYPVAGAVESYGLDPKQKAVEFDPDAIVDEGVASGEVQDTSAYVLMIQREWRVTRLEPISPELPLWVAPPDGTLVVDLETDRMTIAGKSESESREILADEGILSPRPTGGTPSRSNRTWILLAINVIAIAGIVWFLRRKSVPRP